MTEESYLLDKKERNWLSRLLKVIFFACAIILVGMTVLSNMGGSNDSLKETVERFVSGVFGGKKTSVDKLVYMGFFPKIGFDAQGVNVLSAPDKGHIIAHIDKIQVFMPFWNVVTQTPKITKFYIENLTTIRGVVGSEELYIEKVFIDHDLGAKTAKLRGNGKIGVHKWSFITDMNVFGQQGGYTYSFHGSFPLVFDIADIHFEGTIVKHETSYYKLEDFKLSSGDDTLEGNIVLSAIGNQLLKLTGDIGISGGQSAISSDVILDYTSSPAKISGKILSDNLVYSDIVDESSAFYILKRLFDVTGLGDAPNGKASFLGDYNLDVNLDFKSIELADTVINNFTFPIVQTNVGIKFGPIKGDLDIMPPLMFVTDKDTGNIISILQNGQLDLNFLKNWLTNIPNKIGDRVNTECGFAVFSHDSGDLSVQKFAVNTDKGSIKIRESKIGADQNVNDLTFYTSPHTEKLSEIKLDKEAYDFVQSSFQEASEVSSCASYISQKTTETNDYATSGEAQE